MAVLLLPSAFSASSHQASPRAARSSAVEGFFANSSVASDFKALSLPLAKSFRPSSQSPW